MRHFVFSFIYIVVVILIGLIYGLWVHFQTPAPDIALAIGFTGFFVTLIHSFMESLKEEWNHGR